jgi:hypothetical protein
MKRSDENVGARVIDYTVVSAFLEIYNKILVFKSIIKIHPAGLEQV